MNFKYSVIRFVPSAAQAEFVNLGILVVGEEPGTAIVRLAPSAARARHLAPDSLVTEFWSFLRDLSADIEKPSDDFDNSTWDKWIKKLMSSDQSMLQFSKPAPIVADEIGVAADLMANEFLSGYLRPRKKRRNTKSSTAKRVRQAYKLAGLEVDRDILERVPVSGKDHSQKFDFAVHNGQIVQLAQAWNFGVSNPQAVIEQVKAWAFTVQDIKQSGGTAHPGNRTIRVSRDVEFRSVYAEPTNNRSREILEEAIHAFDKVEAISMSVNDVQELGNAAIVLLH